MMGVSPGGRGKGPKKILKKCFLGVYEAGEGELKNDGRESRGRGKEPKKILKNFFEKKKVFLDVM